MVLAKASSSNHLKSFGESRCPAPSTPIRSEPRGGEGHASFFKYPLQDSKVQTNQRHLRNSSEGSHRGDEGELMWSELVPPKQLHHPLQASPHLQPSAALMGPVRLIGLLVRETGLGLQVCLVNFSLKLTLILCNF